MATPFSEQAQHIGGVLVFVQRNGLQIQGEGCGDEIRIVSIQTVEQSDHGIPVKAEDSRGADAVAVNTIVHEGGQGELIVVTTGLGEFVEGVEDDFGVGG